MSQTEPNTFQLVPTELGLELRETAHLEQAGFRVDFCSIDLRTGAGNLSRRQPLARAIGDQHEDVIDATCGFGHDAVLLALMGFQVRAIERHATVAALVNDAIERASADLSYGPRLAGRLSLISGDAIECLREMTPPEVIYVDPMYPPKRRASALPPRAAQLLQKLAGRDLDASELLSVARQRARKRVVVKRPRHAEPLGPPPSHTIESKLVRYDVYVI